MWRLTLDWLQQVASCMPQSALALHAKSTPCVLKPGSVFFAVTTLLLQLQVSPEQDKTVVQQLLADPRVASVVPDYKKYAIGIRHPGNMKLQ